jgi:hypothetical protein
MLTSKPYPDQQFLASVFSAHLLYIAGATILPEEVQATFAWSI